MTQNDKIGNIIRGLHVLGEDGLRDYHSIQAVKSAMRKRDMYQRFMGIKSALKNYRVIVGPVGDTGETRVHVPTTNTTVWL